jgi:hypothetical protein
LAAMDFLHRASFRVFAVNRQFISGLTIMRKARS